MIGPGTGARVLVATRPVDFRKGAGSLAAMVSVIVVTADTAADLRERCMESGADEVLRKPIALGTLLNAMGKIIAKRGPGGVTLI